MSNRKRSKPLAEAPCLACGDPLPESRAKTRRYCSASCRTKAYNLRVLQQLVSNGPADDPLLPQWVLSPSGEVPLLTSAKASLKEVAATLDGLARRIEAEESALRRDLDRVSTRLAKEQALQRDLAKKEQQVQALDDELRQLREQLAERNAQRAVGVPTDPVPTTLTLFPAADVPESLPQGIFSLVGQTDDLRRFARWQAERFKASYLADFADGLDLLYPNLFAASLSARHLFRDGARPPSVAMLHGFVVRELLPAFDNTYRCVKMLRSSLRLARLESLREVTEWMFACFVAVLKLPGLSPLYPIGKSFDPREHEAVAVVANATLPAGSVADVEQVGFLFAEKLLRPAVVIVVAPKTGTSSS
jgi:hypothetical protein